MSPKCVWELEDYRVKGGHLHSGFCHAAVHHSLCYPFPEAFSHSFICFIPVNVLFSFFSDFIPELFFFSPLGIYLQCCVLINYCICPSVDGGKTEGYVQGSQHSFTGGLIEGSMQSITKFPGTEHWCLWFMGSLSDPHS